MSEMTSRERVLTALNHQEPDRVPVNLGGTASNFTDIAYFKMKDYLDIEGEIKPYRRGHTGNYFDQRILEKLDIDFRYVVINPPSNFDPIIIDNNTIKNEWGLKLKKINGYGTRIDPPLEKNITKNDIKNHHWPEPYDPGRVKGLKKEAKDLYNNTTKAVVGRAPLSASFLEYGAWLRGMENFLVDLISDKKLSNYLLDKLLDIQMGFYDSFLTEVGDYIHIVETAEDYGTQDDLLISPDLFREMIKPRRKKLNDLIKSKCPHVKILHHTCGSVVHIISDLSEIGVDVLNPLQPTPKGMDLKNINEKYGSIICFDGGIDTQEALSGSKQEVKKEVEARISQLSSGGGYFLAPSNHIQRDVPPENVKLMFEWAKKVGKYK